MFFHYLQTTALIILNKTENHKEDRCLKINILILAFLICYLNLQHFKKHQILDQVSTESTLPCCARSRHRSDKYTRTSWKADVLESTAPILWFRGKYSKSAFSPVVPYKYQLSLYISQKYVLVKMLCFMNYAIALILRTKHVMQYNDAWEIHKQIFLKRLMFHISKGF